MAPGNPRSLPRCVAGGRVTPIRGVHGCTWPAVRRSPAQAYRHHQNMRYLSHYMRLVDGDVEDRTVVLGAWAVEMPPLTGVHGQPAVAHGVAQASPVGLSVGTDVLGGVSRCPRGEVV